MIIDDDIKRLVKEIEAAPQSSDDNIAALIARLHENCAKPENRARYETAPTPETPFAPYPVDDDGYAVSFDPLTDEQGFVDAWRTYGIVIGKSVLDRGQCAATITTIKEKFNALSNGACDLDQSSTWDNMPRDENGTPLLSRGFLEIYHDDALAQIRQNVRSYIHHVLIWGRADLWSSFDRLGVKLPHHEESAALPLHVDQNPNIHPHFKTVQGVLALTDCPAERGTFYGVPGSSHYFEHYAEMAKNKGEYVELATDHAITEDLRAHAMAFPLRAGDLISWDSRTTHANTSNISNDMRMVFYMAAGPAREDLPEALTARQDALFTGLGTNVREALMHASKKPRFTAPARTEDIRTPEQLNLLGRLLYGTESYRKITAPSAS